MVFFVLSLLALPISLAIPAEPHWFEQRVDHFSTSTAKYKQRYYVNETNFGGPGSPIFVILGGEGGIPPSVGIYYPWVTDVLAKEYHALVLEPEHRFYGESLPFGNDSFSAENLRLMNSQQAVADAAHFIREQQRRRNCTERGTKGYCPVLTIGGSYPGFLSAMMRLRYPAVVDMAYAASAPMKFYTQQVEQLEYYDRVTRSAERSLAGCPAAVKKAFLAVDAFFANASVEEISERFSVCKPLPETAKTAAVLADDLLFLAEQTFANLNMANYPPNNSTALHRTCQSFLAAEQHGTSALVDAVVDLLLGSASGLNSVRRAGKALVEDVNAFTASQIASTCFDLASQLPAGAHATARCGDWSGCGAGHDGMMWDYQTCTFEVEKIGFGGKAQMFPEHSWTSDWLRDHCARRFGVTPQPKTLTDLWGFDAANLAAEASRIVFTNGLNDGWSVGGFFKDLAPEKGVVSINMPNGAHHSDLSHSFGSSFDTPDVIAAHKQILGLVGEWLAQVRDPSIDQSSTSGLLI
eukprot:TRINITY_DN104227_c0_g1_i1.p1 TRINITY_DN104227_c0_g1~~TRINITY_DN104227_c0_g1_i1.p1  ORF type:complete len:523 (-),score=69.49 TRINITY_DN104227_c0_g1_i1:146-1714(-)